MNPIITKALAICAAHLWQFTAPYGSCMSIQNCTTTTYTQEYTPQGYPPGYEACAKIQAVVDAQIQRQKDTAAKKQLALDAPILEQAADVLGIHKQVTHETPRQHPPFPRPSPPRAPHPRAAQDAGGTHATAR